MQPSPQQQPPQPSLQQRQQENTVRERVRARLQEAFADGMGKHLQPGAAVAASASAAPSSSGTFDG